MITDNAKTIIFFAHSLEHEPAHKATAAYCRRFPDVEVRQVSNDLPPFPKSLEERKALNLEKWWPILDQYYFDAFKAAEKEGYGAAISASGADFGVRDAMDKLSIPVTSITYTGCLKARQLGKKFSVLTPQLMSVSLIEKQMIDYGFTDLFLSAGHFDFGDTFGYLAGNITPDFDARKPVAMKSIYEAKKKGAELILLGCGSPDIQKFAPLLNEESLAKYDIPVLTPIDTAVEVARSMIAGRK